MALTRVAYRRATRPTRGTPAPAPSPPVWSHHTPRRCNRPARGIARPQRRLGLWRIVDDVRLHLGCAPATDRGIWFPWVWGDLPDFSGKLSTFAYLWPSAARLLRPLLERKGAKNKKKFIARRSLG